MRAVQILSLLLLLASVALSQEVICGKVVSVSDGDTITVLTPEKTQIRVRIAFVDCPESHQPFGARAKQAMSALVFGKEVELGTQGKDRYGRVLALVYLDGTDVGLEMIKIVLAWPYYEYLVQGPVALQDDYRNAAESAKANRLGLWSDPDPMPPWQWRAARREADRSWVQAHGGE